MLDGSSNGQKTWRGQTKRADRTCTFVKPLKAKSRPTPKHRHCSLQRQEEPTCTFRRPPETTLQRGAETPPQVLAMWLLSRATVHKPPPPPHRFALRVLKTIAAGPAGKDARRRTASTKRGEGLDPSGAQSPWQAQESKDIDVCPGSAVRPAPGHAASPGRIQGLLEAHRYAAAALGPSAVTKSWRSRARAERHCAEAAESQAGEPPLSDICFQAIPFHAQQ